MNNYIKKYYEQGILKTSNHNNELVYHLDTPCEIKIPNKITTKIKEEYNPNLEKGGFFEVMPVINLQYHL